jgi:hypothetical protein
MSAGQRLSRIGEYECHVGADPRFSVEFWDVDKLAEKARLYSATHFYAGSYFNVYVEIGGYC